MTYVVALPCNNCKTTDCVAVCPVDAFYEGLRQLYINPDECINCALCVDECPQNAIWADYLLPSKFLPWLQENEDQSKSGKLPNILNKKKK